KIIQHMSFRRIPTSTRVEHFCFCGDETFCVAECLQEDAQKFHNESIHEYQPVSISNSPDSCFDCPVFPRILAERCTRATATASTKPAAANPTKSARSTAGGSGNSGRGRARRRYRSHRDSKEERIRNACAASSA